MYGGSDWEIQQNLDGSVTLGQNLPIGYPVLLSVSDQPFRGTGLSFSGPVKDPASSCALDPTAGPYAPIARPAGIRSRWPVTSRGAA